MTLNADLAEAELSGEVSELYFWPSVLEDPDRIGRYLPTTNIIAISNGQVIDSRFSANWEVQDTDSVEAVDDNIVGFSGEMLGAFYGPNGEEIAGVITGSRILDSITGEVFLGEVFARGSFSGLSTTTAQEPGGL